MPKQGPRSIKTKEKIKNVTRTGGARDACKFPRMGARPSRSCYVFDFLFFIQEKNRERNTNGGGARAHPVGASAAL